MSQMLIPGNNLESPQNEEKVFNMFPPKKTVTQE